MKFIGLVKRLWQSPNVRKYIHIHIKGSDYISDIMYIIYEEFYNDELKVSAILSLVLVPLVIYIAILLRLCKKKSKRDCVFWIFFGIIISFCYPILSLLNCEPWEEEFMFIEQLGRIDIILETFPQLIIQGLNNSLIGKWSYFSYFSYVSSSLSAMRGLYMLSSTIHRYQYKNLLKKLRRNGLKIFKEKLRQENIEIEPEFMIPAYFKGIFNDKYIANDQLISKIRPLLSLKVNEIIDFILFEIDNSLRIVFNKKKCCENSFNFIPIMIYFEVVLGFLTWLCNILYFFIANFATIGSRYAFLAFLGFLYIMSILDGSLKNDSFFFAKWIVFRLFMLSHFDYFIKMLYDGIIGKITFGPLYELLIIIVARLPIVVIQLVNYFEISSFGGIHWVSFALNLMSLLVSVLRVGHLFILAAIKFLTNTS